MKRLKSYLILVVLCAATTLQAESNIQRGEKSANQPSREQIQQEKRKHLVKVLELTEKEADELMPILNELDEQRFKLWQSVGDVRHRIHQKEAKLSDAEYETFFTKVMDNRVREAELERTYYKKCKAVLPIRKLVGLERANREFARQFFHKRRR